MAKRNRHSFQKMEKEIKRKKKAKEKLARRQNKKIRLETALTSKRIPIDRQDILRGKLYECE